MLLYAAVWTILLVLWGVRNDAWPPPEMWLGLSAGEGVLMGLFAGENAARRRRNGNGGSSS